jgi:YD repeat-containing protein
MAQGSSTVGFAYDSANRRTTLTLANGVTLTYGYDNANQLTSITYRDAASTLLGDLTYGYDPAGRRTAMGGSFARTGLPSAIASATYDVNNRLTNWNGAALSYDANGNLLGFAGDTYTWNKRDQLSGVSGTNTASFQYDAVGRRQAKTVAGTSTQFLYDGLNPIQEKAGSTVTASILTGLGIDEFLARSEGANTQHFLTDALGSTVRLTDNSAAKSVDYTYEPYGDLRRCTLTTTGFNDSLSGAADRDDSGERVPAGGVPDRVQPCEARMEVRYLPGAKVLEHFVQRLVRLARRGGGEVRGADRACARCEPRLEPAPERVGLACAPEPA